MRRILYILMMPMLLVSCVEEYDAALPASESQLLVVEGTILSDTVSTFYLSLTVPINSDEGIVNVDDATMQLKGSDGTVVNAKHTDAGTYQIDTPELNANTDYSLVINYNGDTYQSDAQEPIPTVGLERVEASQPSSTSNVNFLITTAVPANTAETQYYRWTYEETWEIHPFTNTVWYWDSKQQKAVNAGSLIYPTRGWLSASSGDIIASSSAYYTNNQIVQYKLYDVSYANRRLWYIYSTEVTQRSISKAEYEYETERKKISTEMGGLFTPQPSSLPTNIHCTTSDKRAIGYVGCSLNLARYRIFVKPENLSHVQKDESYTLISNTSEGYPGEQEMYDRDYLLQNYMDDFKAYYWASKSDMDIRTMTGISLDKPSYWPN